MNGRECMKDRAKMSIGEISKWTWVKWRCLESGFRESGGMKGEWYEECVGTKGARRVRWVRCEIEVMCKG